jgi:hypothetical protein
LLGLDSWYLFLDDTLLGGATEVANNNKPCLKQGKAFKLVDQIDTRRG